MVLTSEDDFSEDNRRSKMDFEDLTLEKAITLLIVAGIAIYIVLEVLSASGSF